MNFKLLSVLALVGASAGTAFPSTHVSVGLRIGIPPPVIVREAPPRRVSEAVVVSPGPGYIWVAGHYSWNAGQWLWVPGAWVSAPQPGAVWVEGRWDESTKMWTEGHWEIAQTAAPSASVVVTPAPAPVASTIVITSAPPPLRHERHSRRPGHDYVWVNGYWGWDHGRHVWVSGHWMMPPRGHRVWVEPRWERRGGSYVFIEGTWR